MDTRELRINNIVNAHINNSSRFITIVCIQKKYVAEEALKETENPRYPYDYKWISNNNIEAIPLTKEILIKCGFIERQRKNESSSSLFYNDKLTLYPRTVDMNSFYMEHYDIDIKFLHQLQNIYFDLTNEELIIKL